MNEDNLKALIKYRMEQADETLKEAEILFENASYRGTINRAYYSMFYSVLALLTMKKLGSSKHSGVISLFDREFVKTGLFTRDKSRSLRIAFDRRQTHDYGELIKIEKDIAHDTLKDARGFILAVRKYLSSAGYI
jgi:uncharacterized protein (UPF0332 family)